jgi:F-type H+-transporting ATPase subunit delta
VSLLESHAELHTILTHPAVSAERKGRIASEVWVDRTGTELVPRLMALLAERDRVELLPGIEEIYSELWNAQRGVVSAEAATAQHLSPQETQSLAQALGRAVGKEVELVTRVEPELLGGVLVKMQGRTYDGTVRGRLRSLRRHLGQEAGVPRVAAAVPEG